MNCVSPQKVTMSILKIHAREIFDSRGNPTVEVDLYTSKGKCTFVSAPLPHSSLCKTSNDRVLGKERSIVKTFPSDVHVLVGCGS